MKIKFVIREITGSYYNGHGSFRSYLTAKHYNTYTEAEEVINKEEIRLGSYQIDKVFVKE